MSTGAKTCGPTTTNLNITEVHCRHLPGIGGSLGVVLTWGRCLPELEYFQKMLVQTLSITTPPIVQDFDWPALVQQVQREKGSEQVSIIDVGGGMPHLSVPSFLRAALISCGSTPDRSWDCASLALGEHSFIGGERNSVRPGIGDREGPDQVGGRPAPQSHHFHRG
jgi:hypothetical protein